MKKSKAEWTQVAQSGQQRFGLEDLRSLMAFLRSDEGCPWDRKQTVESLQPHLQEEAHETSLAALAGSDAAYCEELGDLLLQVVFQAQLAEEAGRFSLDEVISGICRKLLYRHAHLFDQVLARNESEALAVWERQKEKEKQGQESTSLADDLAVLVKASREEGVKGINALQTAYLLQKEASKEGFDWTEPCFEKVLEEHRELEEAWQEQGEDRLHLEEEAGDLLFIVTNLIRLMNLSPELALTKANLKFARRYTGVRQLAAKEGKRVSELNEDERYELWCAVKQGESNASR